MMSESSHGVDPTRTILLPEVESKAVQAFQVINEEASLPVRFEGMSLDSALDLLEANEVAAVLAGAIATTGEVIKMGIERFNPKRNEAGEEDPDGVRQRVSSYFFFEKDGDTPFIIGDCAVNVDPDEERLAEIAEQTVENARRLAIDPHVAFLSYSTLRSGHGESSAKVREATAIFRERHPEVPTIGEVQFDAATERNIYQGKTGEDWPGSLPPNVFIAPNLDTGNNIYKVLQSRRFGGGWTAIGPLLQGFEGGRQLHDLSRGVTPAALEATCRRIAQLCGLPTPEKTMPPAPNLRPETSSS